jgi:hypothetical protein
LVPSVVRSFSVTAALSMIPEVGVHQPPLTPSASDDAISSGRIEAASPSASILRLSGIRITRRSVTARPISLPLKALDWFAAQMPCSCSPGASRAST